MSEQRGAGDAAGVVSHGYITYPHARGWLGERRVLVGRPDGAAVRLDCVDPETGEREAVARWEGAAGEPVWWDAADDGSRLVVHVGGAGGFGGAAWRVDRTPRGWSEPVRVLEPAAGEVLLPVPSITRAGDRCLQVRQRGGRFDLLEVGLDSGEVRELADLGPPPPEHRNDHLWWNHVHYCPFDEAWIGYCNNCVHNRIPDRVYALHAEHAPAGRLVLDHRLGTPSPRLYTGHERWAFHDAAAAVVAYSNSPDAERAGLWMVYPDARPPRQVLRHTRACHCDISRDGRWAVVDTFGPHDLPPESSWSFEDRTSDILLVDLEAGSFDVLARTRFGPLPPAGGSRVPAHPYHPHPAFGPGGEWVVFNDYDDAAGRGVVRACRVV